MKTEKKTEIEPHFFLSDCGNYIAVHTDFHKTLGSGSFDVIAKDGSCVWLNKRYKAKGFNDPRLKYPEFPNMVVGYHNYGRYDCRGRWIYKFELLFADLDINKIVQPWEGNCIIRKYTAMFRKPVSFNL